MGTLYIIATPIGNLEDMTYRAVRVLGEVDVLACEDTRRTKILLDRYGIARPALVFPHHEHNEAGAAERIVGLLRDGKTVGICSNAGYPGISDPGFPAIRRAIEEGFPVVVLPGAGAVPVALLSSGLPSSGYTFKGFAPRRPGRRRSFLASEAESPHTLIFYESPFRIASFLSLALEVYGDREAAVCLELTKQFERIQRGYLSDLAEAFRGVKVKGEATIVVAGNHPKFCRDGVSAGDAEADDEE